LEIKIKEKLAGPSHLNPFEQMLRRIRDEARTRQNLKLDEQLKLELMAKKRI
jgi:hypothetical protein